jgi:hypothetical protein
MKGIPPECYEPLPPNSLDDTYCEEVETHSNDGSVATPLLINPERVLVMVEEGTLPINPTFQVPIEPLLLCLDSPSNVIEEDYPWMSSRPYTETNMESTQSDFNDEYLMFVLLAWSIRNRILFVLYGELHRDMIFTKNSILVDHLLTLLPLLVPRQDYLVRLLTIPSNK